MALEHQTTRKPPSYSSDPAWSDVLPIPQNDGGSDALATIAYTDEYREAMSYLRAIMAADEHSERGLALTSHLVTLNPSHYTVWLFRAATLFALDKDIREEIRWLNGVALEHLKNYQIWHHRQLLIDKLSDSTGETAFLAAMFAKDSKNYHVWSYRAWLVKRFSLWDSEIPDIDRLLEEDILNNSAWNHRYYCIFGRTDKDAAAKLADQATVDAEISFTTAKIAIAPQNQSAWNYLRGVLNAGGRPLSAVKDLAVTYAPIEEPEKIRSSHALDFLAEIYAAEGRGVDEGKGKSVESSSDGVQMAERALELLAERYDPIRKNYWEYRKSLLVKSEV